ncbi:MAG TPA: DUF222 domain-containing protein [Candidatus Sulfotelmatobacter sp.]|nr:DUF222 domain-containing protein [Candidatus Sulfotelmatobacter sp.]
MASAGSASATALLRQQILPLIATLESRLADVAAPDLGEQLEDIRRTIDRLEVTFARTLARFDATKEYLAEAFVSPNSWLRFHCRLSPGAATQRIDLARHLDELPRTKAALLDGAIGFQHAALLCRAAARVGADAVRREEDHLICMTRTLDPGRFAELTTDLIYRASPDLVLDEHNRQYVARELEITELSSGFYRLQGRLDPVGGATVVTALNALSEPGNPARERADALVELAHRSLDAGTLPEVAGQRPHLTVTASIETLALEPGHPTATIEWGSVVSAETARRVACDAALTRVLLSGDGQPLDVGRTTRIISPALRKALNVRDRGCRFPGCNRPPDWTDGHHLKHWADGGPTNLSNLALLCRKHHHMVHEEGWRILWGEDAGILAIPPQPLRRYCPAEDLARAG